MTLEHTNKGRTIFILDIHGCYDEFMLLLEKLEITKEDKVYLTGDLVIRGPKDIKVLDFLLKNKKQFQAIKGNQEHFILTFLDKKKDLIDILIHHKEKEIKRKNLKKYEEKISYIKELSVYKEVKNLCKKIKDREEYITYLKSLPKYIETDDFILVHAGFLIQDIKEESIEVLTGISRNLKYDWYKDYSGNKKVIYGHQSPQGLTIHNNTIGIDTGCANGLYLTAYTFETGEILQQKAFKTYKQLKYDPGKIKR